MANRAIAEKEYRNTAPVYEISADESARIQILRLWMALLVPINHALIQTVDNARLAAILPPWLEALQYILSFIVTRYVPPAFALLSAVLLYRKPFRWHVNVARKFRSLIVPIVILSSFWIVLYAVVPSIPGIGSLFSSARVPVAGWTPRRWLEAYFDWNANMILYPLWFLRDLMLMNLIAPAIKWIIDRLPRLFLCVLAAMLVWKNESSFFFHTVHQVFVFFCLGCYVVKYNLRFSDLDRIPGALIAGLYALTILGAYLARPYFRKMGVVRAFPNLIGSLFFARFFTKIPDGKWKKRLLWLADFNFAIYLFHERMLTFFRKLLIVLLPTNLVSAIIVFHVLPLAVIVFCVLIAWLLHRYQPRFYAVITGGR